MKIRLHTIDILWSKIGVIPEEITYLKTTATRFFWLAPKSQRSELSIEVLHNLVSQRAAELQAIKFGSQKKADILGSRLRFSRFYVVIATAQVRYPAGADFEGLQLCSPLTYKDV